MYILLAANKLRPDDLEAEQGAAGNGFDAGVGGESSRGRWGTPTMVLQLRIQHRD